MLPYQKPVKHRELVKTGKNFNFTYLTINQTRIKDTEQLQCNIKVRHTVSSEG